MLDDWEDERERVVDGGNYGGNHGGGYGGQYGYQGYGAFFLALKFTSAVTSAAAARLNEPLDSVEEDEDEPRQQQQNPRQQQRCTDANEPLFSVEVLKAHAALGHGRITCGAAGNSVVAVGTSDGWLVRYDFLNDELAEINLTSHIPPDTASSSHSSATPAPINGSYRIHVKSVFVDPGGRHTLAVLQHTPLGAPFPSPGVTAPSPTTSSSSSSSRSGHGSGMGGAVAGMYAGGTYWDVVYVHGGWQRARHVARHRMAIGAVAAVAWHPAPMAHDGSTREIILATEGGRLYEAAFEEADKRDRPLKLLFELPNAEKCPFRGIQMEVLGLHGGGSSGGGFSGGGGGAGGGTTAPGASSQRFFVLAATATRLLAFVGSTSLEVSQVEHYDNA
ncbi:unnamed protein product [Closterium sp. NIES-54]